MTRFLSAVLTAIRVPPVAAGARLLAAALLAAPLLTALLLAGCAGSDGTPRPMHIAARMESGIVMVEVSNIPPGREITALVLIDAAGGETPAREREVITREESSGGNAGPGVGIGATGGSSSGVHPYISLGYLFRADSSTRRSQRMTAEIALPDPAAYAAGYRDWRLELRYRDQLGEAQRVSVPAPPPDR